MASPTSPELTRSALDPRAAARLRADLVIALPDLWDDDVSASLADEAGSAWTTAAPPSVGPTRRVADGRPGRRPTLLAGGPVLDDLHRSLSGVARALTGQALVASFASYYFYDGNDEVRLHLDTDQCDLTMITEVLGDLGPLHVHHELAGMTIDDLFALEEDPDWDRQSGRPIQHPRSGVTAFRGRRLPHHRPGRQLAGIGAVAAFHYRARYASPRGEARRSRTDRLPRPFTEPTPQPNTPQRNQNHEHDHQ